MTELSNRVAASLKWPTKPDGSYLPFNPRLDRILFHYDRKVEQGIFTISTALDKVLSDYSGSNVSGQIRTDR